MGTPLEAAVVLLQKTDGRDLLMKLMQTSSGLCSVLHTRRGQHERAKEWKSAMFSVLDARALLWMGRWIVQAHRLRGVLRARQGWTRRFMVLQLCASATYFFIDNFRWLMKHKMLTKVVDLDALRARNRVLQQIGYTAALLAELARYTEYASEFTARAVVKAILDILNATLPVYVPSCTYEPMLCGFVSSSIGLRSLYTRSLSQARKQ